MDLRGAEVAVQIYATCIDPTWPALLRSDVKFSVNSAAGIDNSLWYGDVIQPESKESNDIVSPIQDLANDMWKRQRAMYLNTTGNDYPLVRGFRVRNANNCAFETKDKKSCFEKPLQWSNDTDGFYMYPNLTISETNYEPVVWNVTTNNLVQAVIAAARYDFGANMTNNLFSNNTVKGQVIQTQDSPRLVNVTDANYPMNALSGARAFLAIPEFAPAEISRVRTSYLCMVMRMKKPADFVVSVLGLMFALFGVVFTALAFLFHKITGRTVGGGPALIGAPAPVDIVHEGEEAQALTDKDGNPNGPGGPDGAAPMRSNSAADTLAFGAGGKHNSFGNLSQLTGKSGGGGGGGGFGAGGFGAGTRSGSGFDLSSMAGKAGGGGSMLSMAGGLAGGLISRASGVDLSSMSSKAGGGGSGINLSSLGGAGGSGSGLNLAGMAGKAASGGGSGLSLSGLASRASGVDLQNMANNMGGLRPPNGTSGSGFNLATPPMSRLSSFASQYNPFKGNAAAAGLGAAAGLATGAGAAAAYKHKSDASGDTTSDGGALTAVNSELGSTSQLLGQYNVSNPYLPSPGSSQIPLSNSYPNMPTIPDGDRPPVAGYVPTSGDDYTPRQSEDPAAAAAAGAAGAGIGAAGAAAADYAPLPSTAGIGANNVTGNYFNSSPEAMSQAQMPQQSNPAVPGMPAAPAAAVPATGTREAEAQQFGAGGFIQPNQSSFAGRPEVVNPIATPAPAASGVQAPSPTSANFSGLVPGVAGGVLGGIATAAALAAGARMSSSPVGSPVVSPPPQLPAVQSIDLNDSPGAEQAPAVPNQPVVENPQGMAGLMGQGREMAQTAGHGVTQATGNVAQEIQNAPQTLQNFQGIPHEMVQNAQAAVPPNLQNIPQNVQSAVPQGLPQNLQNIPQSVQSAVPQNVQSAIPQSAPRDMSGVQNAAMAGLAGAGLAGAGLGAGAAGVMGMVNNARERARAAPQELSQNIPQNVQGVVSNVQQLPAHLQSGAPAAQASAPVPPINSATGPVQRGLDSPEMPDPSATSPTSIPTPNVPSSLPVPSSETAGASPTNPPSILGSDQTTPTGPTPGPTPTAMTPSATRDGPSVAGMTPVGLAPETATASVPTGGDRPMSAFSTDSVYSQRTSPGRRTSMLPVPEGDNEIPAVPAMPPHLAAMGRLSASDIPSTSSIPLAAAGAGAGALAAGAAVLGLRNDGSPADGLPTRSSMGLPTSPGAPVTGLPSTGAAASPVAPPSGLPTSSSMSSMTRGMRTSAGPPMRRPSPPDISVPKPFATMGIPTSPGAPNASRTSAGPPVGYFQQAQDSAPTTPLESDSLLKQQGQ